MDYHNKGLNYSAVLADYRAKVRKARILNGKVVLVSSK